MFLLSSIHIFYHNHYKLSSVFLFEIGGIRLSVVGCQFSAIGLLKRSRCGCVRTRKLRYSGVFAIKLSWIQRFSGVDEIFENYSNMSASVPKTSIKPNVIPGNRRCEIVGVKNSKTIIQDKQYFLIDKRSEIPLYFQVIRYNSECILGCYYTSPYYKKIRGF